MPRYFFDIHDGEAFTPTVKGWIWTTLRQPRMRPRKPCPTL
jgi:hypothetical protein